MQTKTLLLASLSLFAGISTNAAVDVATWTTAGHAWDPARQTTYSSSGDIIADGTTDALMNVSDTSSGGLFWENPGFGGASFYYSLFATPTINLVANDVTIVDTYLNLFISTGASISPLLSFGVNTEIAPVNSTSNFFSWDVSSFSGDTDSITISWDFGQHSDMDEVTLTQSSVIPEPQTYALLGSIAVLALAFLRRYSATKR